MVLIRSRRALWLPLTALGLILGLSCPPVALSSRREGPDPGVAREFQELCLALRQSDEPYVGQTRLRELAAWAEHAELKPPTGAPSADDARLLELAREQIDFGRSEVALETLEKADERARGYTSEWHQRIRRLELVAHLQAAEDANCVLDHSAGSCLLPVRADAVHRRPAHAERAGDLALEILKEEPEAATARWLLNLSRMLTADFPRGVPEKLRIPADALRSEERMRPWRNRAPELGLDAVDLAGGALLDDFDGDGLLDVVTSTADPCDHLKAFRNDGQGGFEDVSAAWGLDAQLGGLNVVHADYDGDGDLDLLVLRGGWRNEFGRIRNSLLRNDLARSGRFVDVTRQAGLAEPALPTQTAAWADYDGDGDLDLYVGNEDWNGASHPSQLFRNEGNGRFRDVAALAGVSNDRFAKGVAWGDYDGDGDPDLYVSNIGPNRLYRNEGDGRFRDVAVELGVEQPVRRSFATWFFDYDNDGDLDLFVADYDTPTRTVIAAQLGAAVRSGHPLIYRNDGDRFREVSAALGLRRPLLPMGANFGDLDNDGWLDVYLGTGEPSYEALLPNVMLHNVQGVRFADVSYAGGFAHLQKGHGVAFGDIDNDGDQDLLHQLGGFYPGDAFGNALFENPGSDASWVTLRLEGRRANRFGVGARIEVRVRSGEAVRSLYRVAGSGGSFGGSSLQQEIGLGDAERIEEIRIDWPGSGTHQVLRDLAVDHFYRVVEGAEAAILLEQAPLRLGGKGGTRGRRSTRATTRTREPRPSSRAAVGYPRWMGQVETRAGRLAGAPGLLLACLLAACGGGAAVRDAAGPEPAQACLDLATPYHSIARNKDLGSTKEHQLLLVRQVAFEDPSANVEALAFMEHVVELVYRYPDDDAETIRQRILDDCEIDADGKPVLRTLWDQP